MLPVLLNQMHSGFTRFTNHINIGENHVAYADAALVEKLINSQSCKKPVDHEMFNFDMQC